MAELFGRFTLIRKIASGGMADLYLASTTIGPGAGARLALKRIRPQFCGDEDFLAMLTQEAAISLQLHHANIVTTYEFGQVEGQYYLSMEYIDGLDLFRILQQLDDQNGQLPVPAAAFIAQQLCRGLHHAHGLKDAAGESLNIVHRDVSPMNILISRTGLVKICDFGIARARTHASKTKSGVIKGKFHYLSPEYSSGQAIDHRTDQFAVGICLWEMLASRMLYPPIEGESLLEVVRAARIPSLRLHRSDVPPVLEGIVMQALARSREERFPSCAELEQALGRFLDHDFPNFARDQLAEFFHNHLRMEYGLDERADMAGPARPASGTNRRNEPARRGPEQHTARIQLAETAGAVIRVEGSVGRHEGYGTALNGQGRKNSEEKEMADKPKGLSDLGGKTVAMSADDVFGNTEEGAAKPAPTPAKPVRAVRAQPAPRPAAATAAPEEEDVAPPRPAPASRATARAVPAKAAPPAEPKAPADSAPYDQKTAFFNAADPRIAAALAAAKSAAPGATATPAAKRTATGPAPATEALKPLAPPGAAPARRVARPAPPDPASGEPQPAPAVSARTATPSRPQVKAAPEQADAYSQKTAFFDAADPRIAKALEEANKKKAVTPTPATEAPPSRPSVSRPVVRKIEAPTAETPAAAPQPKIVKASAGIKVVKVGAEEQAPAEQPAAEPAASAKDRIAQARARKAELAAKGGEAAQPAAEEPASEEKPAKRERPPRREKAAPASEESADKAEQGEDGEESEAKKPRAKREREEKAEKPERAEKVEKKEEPQVRVAKGGKEQKKRISPIAIVTVIAVVIFGGLAIFYGSSMFVKEAGNIEVTSQPSGADITYQGKKVGKTPFTIKNVPPDEPQELTLSLDGYQDFTESDVQVGPGETEKVRLITLKPLPGSIKIITDPEGAEVLINGDLQKDKTPLTVKDIERTKSVEIIIQKDGFEENKVIWSWTNKKRDDEYKVTLVKTKRGRSR